MRRVSEVRQALEERVLRGTRLAAGELADLSSVDLRQESEHDVSVLLLLGALSSRMGGGEPVTPALFDIARRYMETSLLYTGRILPRTKEIIELLDGGVDERSPDLLVEVADHLSQGWPTYPDSVFPAGLARLSEGLGLGGEPARYTRVSFVLWWQALGAAAAGDHDRALPLIHDSLERYRKYLYYADAAWLYTDIVINHLTAGRLEEAVTALGSQRHYVEEVYASHPSATGARSFAFSLGDVQSGSYSTFIESSSLRPKELSDQDRALLKRYVRTSEFLIAACRYGSRRDFDAALDVFSFGWVTFQQSPYPRIFRHLADRYGGRAGSWSVHLTAHEQWHRMLRTYRVRTKARQLIDVAVTLHDRLAYAGLEQQADLVLLDAAVLHERLHGKGAAVEWITRYLIDIRPSIPEILQVAVDYLQAPQNIAGRRFLSKYIGLRTDFLVPEILPVVLLDEPGTGSPSWEVALYGNLLSVEGVTVYEETPPPLLDILRVLGEEFMRSREKNEEPSFLSASELSARTHRTPAALAQSVRRFRMACRERFDEVTDWDIASDAVIQGRPGYRMNPQSVRKFTSYSTID
ncbi:tetratricopeptide repeat protein [Streptomyces xinghaiensis]|uniref:tetratricopeptide repeat protein n=1 Tax=Streptomyces xinghaiensis TaxID=1038928 RepID=UPI002E11073C|nr:tetratricopeptide repeat protein [Streptomyces xinghaiensis]